MTEIEWFIGDAHTPEEIGAATTCDKCGHEGCTYDLGYWTCPECNASGYFSI